jgi:thiamine transporter ThiT
MDLTYLLITLYIVQFIGGIILWRKFKFDCGDSTMFSALVVPNLILLSLVLEELICSFYFFLREKLKDKKR